MYMRDPANPAEEDGCFYSFPLPLSPVVDPTDMRVIRIDVLPTGLDEKVKPLEPWKSVPGNEYIPEAHTLRTDLKPIRISQPEGVSFQVQKFSELG
jgi:primary-amine oxidase